MCETDTVIFEVQTPEEIVAATDRMFSDLQVGAFAVRNFLNEDELQQLIAVDGAGFTETERMQSLGRLLASHITGSEQAVQVCEFAYLTYGHDWHLPVNDRKPMIRPWLHLRGNAEFWLARSADPSVSGYGYSDSDAEELSFARPVMFKPNPNDLLCFVDRGCPGITGNSTIHKVVVPDWGKRSGDADPRLSVNADFVFDA